MLFPHLSVLQGEVLALLKEAKIEIFVDGTLGAGGHAAKILETHPEICHFLGIDSDPTALLHAEKRLANWKKKVTLINGNFSQIDTYLNQLSLSTIDAALLDLGVSSMQLDTKERGFSFLKEGPLDMRQDPKNPLTAQEIVNTWDEEDLARIFFKFGEEKRARVFAKAIARARKEAPLNTTYDLVRTLEPFLQYSRRKSIHPLTRCFQALRIVVNDELAVLEMTLPKILLRLKPKGRLLVISFHSLEDRIVKKTFRYYASDKETTIGYGGVFLSKQPLVHLVTKKPIVPSQEEMAANPRSRSAKMRVIEKI